MNPKPYKLTDARTCHPPAHPQVTDALNRHPPAPPQVTDARTCHPPAPPQVTDALNRRRNRQGAKLRHPPSTYVTGMLVPRGGSIAVDRQVGWGGRLCRVGCPVGWALV